MRRQREVNPRCGSKTCLNGIMRRVDEGDFARKAATQEVLGDVQSYRSGPVASAHKNNAARLKQNVEVPHGHSALRWLRVSNHQLSWWFGGEPLEAV